MSDKPNYVSASLHNEALRELAALRARLVTLESELAGDMRPTAVLRRENDQLREDNAALRDELASERHRYSELHVTCTGLEGEANALRAENAALQANLPKRPDRGVLVVDIFYSHGDWTEPYRFGHGYSLRLGTMEMKRDILREFWSTAAEDFHERLSAAFMLVGDAEQRSREIKWQAEAGVPFEREEVSTAKTKLERDNAALRALVKDCQSDLAEWIVPDSGISDKAVIIRLLERLDGPQARAALGKEAP